MKKIFFFLCIWVLSSSFCPAVHAKTDEPAVQQESDEDIPESRPISINISVTNIHDARSNNKTATSQTQEKYIQEQKKNEEEKKGISIANIIILPAWVIYQILKPRGPW